jgi:hypothetical protein
LAFPKHAHKRLVKIVVLVVVEMVVDVAALVDAVLPVAGIAVPASN